MLIISIGHDRTNDPFTYSCVCENDILDPHNMVELLSFIYREHSVLPSTLNQVMVIKDDQILIEYNNEDGLGNDDRDLDLEIQ